MFSKKKTDKPKRDHTGKSLSQYGLFDVPDLNASVDDVDDDDDDLEAELAALSGGGGGVKPKRPPRKGVPQSQLDAMVAASMKDIPSDEDVSGDENDPDLLNELSEIAGDEEPPEPEASPSGSEPSSDMSKLLTERLKMYELAEAAAKERGETSKARRYNRSIKTLKDLLKQASSGNTIDPEEIPPEVKVYPVKPVENTENPSPPAQVIPQASILDEPIEPPKEEPAEPQINKEINQELLQLLNERKMQYKMAALKAKKAGDNETAIYFIKTSKQFDVVISAVQNGQSVNLDNMPGPPGDNTASTSTTRPQRTESIERNKVQTDSNDERNNFVPTMPESGEIPQATLTTASTVLEALEQRLAVYKEQENKAKEEGVAGKVRRLGRIVKQFEQAIKLCKAGKPIPADELPTPPGYGPIPYDPKTNPTSPEASASPASPVQPKPTSSRSTEDNGPETVRISGNHVPTSRAEKQVLILLAKQKQFKLAALKAKQKGEMNEAKEYLRQAKGFDKLLEAARGGLPVDWSSIPVSPEAKSQLDNDYDMVMADECTEDDTSDKDMITRLENILTKQLKMCLSTRDHFKALGDVAGTNRFERLALNVTKDLDVVRLAQKIPGSPIPKFHYENKDFSVVKSFTELGDNDMELLIARGINYKSTNPKEIDTYVKFEFPHPQETPFADRTSTVKDTNNPEYNQTFTIPIQRSQRTCQRVFKRHGIKFEIYSKGGWFKGDTLLGTVNVKLQPLETQCEIHDSFDLLEGRKKTGGKLEVRLRLRTPIVTQQVEQIHEKWLVIDNA